MPNPHRQTAIIAASVAAIVATVAIIAIAWIQTA